MQKSKHTATWFEIPATDIARASKFYGEVLGVQLDPMDFGGSKMAVFPVDGEGGSDVVHGAVVQGEHYTPGAGGPLLYLNGGLDLSEPLSRVEAAGGTVLQPKMAIGDHGHIAIFLDTEGNRLALHSPS